MKTYTIKKTAQISLDQFYNELSDGGRIMVYGYCISIIAMTFRLTSSPYFIRPGEKISKYRFWYNVRSLIFGWWGIPWGPIYTIDLIKINLKHGGIDITDDILIKIKQKYFETDVKEIFDSDITVDYDENELTR